MSLRKFWILIEPRSKILSILPTLIGLLFSATYFHSINWTNSVLFFCGSLLFDATTSSINNIMDFYKGTTHKYRHHSNLVGRNGMNPKITAGIVITMLVISVLIGVILAVRVGWILLILGMFCFAVGIFYTFGPLPLSRLPLGELFSGFTMGVIIPVIAVLVNVEPTGLVGLEFSQMFVTIQFNWQNILALLLLCIQPTAVIAGVELANNISDYDEDLVNDRKTIAMYISRQAGLNWYQFLVYVGFFTTTLAVLIHVLPWQTLLIWLTLPYVIKLTNIFLAKQHKQETFHTSLIIAGVEMSAIVVGLLVDLVI